jgi:hypothetical protein
MRAAIDYIRDLISERSALLSRLQRAREMLPQDHPCVTSLSSSKNGIPLWEREWNGGTGKDLDADNEGEGGGERNGDAAQEDMDDEGVSESEG